MIKLLPILEQHSKILVPRRLEDRQAKRLQADLKRIEEYVKQGSQYDVDLPGSPITKLPDNLTKIGRDLNLPDSKIQDLNNLREVGDFLGLHNTPITTLPDNLTVGGSLSLGNSQLSEIPNNLNIGRLFFVKNTPLSKQYTLEEIKQIIIDKGGSVGMRVVY